MKCCGTSQMDEQPFPQRGILHRNLNLKLKKLKEIGTELGQAQGAEVYVYVLSTVEFAEDKQQFIQTGSAPNFQGNYVTLCTCKRYMRSLRKVADWENIWIAGFTSHKLGQNYLFYLMQVESAFGSFRELWEAGTLPAAMKQAKNASRNRLGDLFHPLSPNKSNDYLIHSYEEPTKGHVHQPKEWHKDIEYENPWGKRAPVVVGNPKFSFLWNEPLILFSSDRKQRRGHWRYNNLQDFWSVLK
jgi:hypothetical protein